MSDRFYLYCPKCHSEYSADAGDYFYLPRTHNFECCGMNCRIVKRGSRFDGDLVISRRATMGLLVQLPRYSETMIDQAVASLTR